MINFVPSLFNGGFVLILQMRLYFEAENPSFLLSSGSSVGKPLAGFPPRSGIKPKLPFLSRKQANEI